MELAETSKNYTVCENVNSSEVMVDYCYDRYAFAANDIEGCRRIKDSSLKDGCLREVGGKVE
jgi:hypothetical protein